MSTSLTGRRRAFVAVTVTLTTANTNYRLLDLVNAVIAAEANMSTPPMTAPDACRELSLQSFPGIDSVGANTNDILVGDGLLSTTRMGYNLQAVGGSRTYRSNIQNVDVGNLYVQSAGSGQKLNVEIVSC